jgi:hypothetical protein
MVLTSKPSTYVVAGRACIIVRTMRERSRAIEKSRMGVYSGD